MAATTLVALFAVGSQLLSWLSKAGPVAAVVLLAILLYWMEWDLHAARQAQPVPKDHRDRICEIAGRLIEQQLVEPTQFTRGFTTADDVGMLEAHFRPFQRAMNDWRERFPDEEKAQQATVTHIAEVVSGFNLADKEPLQNWLWQVAAKHAAPRNPAVLHWDVKPDGAVHLSLDGEDHLIAHSGGRTLAGQLDATVAAFTKWPGLRVWDRAWRRVEDTKLRLRVELKRIKGRAVVRGHCRACD